MEDSFKTVAESAQAETKIQKSIFIASLFKCDSADDAEHGIGEIAKKYHDANHNCFAYRLYVSGGPEVFRYSDAGEPSGTAGRPIYDSIISAGLHNICVVVTRYFGGIKLGTGGLARAYRESALAVLQNAEIREVLICARYKIVFDLSLTNIILRTLASENAVTVESSYSDKGEIIFDIRLSREQKLAENLISRTNARIGLDKISAAS